ncbi:MAG: hypothetical protein AB7O61_11040 [Acidimicrobiia bacterium]
MKQRFLLASLAVIALSACGDDSDAADTTTAIPAVATTPSAGAAVTPAVTPAAPAGAAVTAGVAPTGAPATIAAGRPCVSPSETAGATTRVSYDVTEYKISGATSIKAGKVGIELKNSGQANHELAVFKGSYAAMPKDEFGAVDETKLNAGVVIGRTARFAAGGACGMVVDLPPGQYTLICNVEFKGATVTSHAGKGMVLDLAVA